MATPFRLWSVDLPIHPPPDAVAGWETRGLCVGQKGVRGALCVLGARQEGKEVGVAVSSALLGASLGLCRLCASPGKGLGWEVPRHRLCQSLPLSTWAHQAPHLPRIFLPLLAILVGQ